MGKIEHIVNWLANDTPGNGTPAVALSMLCEKLTAAGVSIVRGAVYVETLHPTIIGRRFIWEEGKDVSVDEASFAFAETDMYRTTPIQEIYRTGKPVRRELYLASCPDDFPAVAEFRSQGMTDYLALPLRFINGEVHAVSWITRRPGGFSESDLDALERINGPLARVAEIYALRRVAGNLLNTYVGDRSGARILAGHIRRGDTEVIDAAIWLSDLRGFTALADALPGEQLIETLNTHFERLVPAVTDNGGEVLKFMGDGMLAIFPTEENETRENAAHSALNAALQARASMAELNAARHENGLAPLSFGLALNIGKIHYGNIGADSRLDFTAIGPAVNLAARMETVAAEKGRDIVVSADFQSYLKTEGELLGEFPVKGFSRPVSIYAVPPSTEDAE